MPPAVAGAPEGTLLPSGVSLACEGEGAQSDLLGVAECTACDVDVSITNSNASPFNIIKWKQLLLHAPMGRGGVT